MKKIYANQKVVNIKKQAPKKGEKNNPYAIVNFIFYWPVRERSYMRILSLREATYISAHFFLLRISKFP